MSTPATTVRRRSPKPSAAPAKAKTYEGRNLRLRDSTMSNLARAVPLSVPTGERAPSLKEFASDALDEKCIPILAKHRLQPA